jgi:hypothetical protein
MYGGDIVAQEEEEGENFEPKTDQSEIAKFSKI